MEQIKKKLATLRSENDDLGKKLEEAGQDAKVHRDRADKVKCSLLLSSSPSLLICINYSYKRGKLQLSDFSVKTKVAF